MSYADKIFVENCRTILNEGISNEGTAIRPRWQDGTPAYSIKKFGLVNRYDLSKEFPLLTLRPINWKAALREILWIWQKKSNIIAELGSKIWDQWEMPDGTIGKAYGYQLGQKHIYPEGEFDQVDRILWELKHTPSSRRMLTSLFNFADLHQMALYPCAWSMTFNVEGDKLNAILNQRSQDMLAANNWNVVQYSALVMMIAQVSGFQPGEFIHVIADAHIYDRHIELVENVISRPAFTAPVFKIDPAVKNFYDFTIDSFEVEDYQHGDKIGAFPIAE
ncbi:MAG: thymidylate synthase [Saccharofermentanales bacterium]|jgi:thymidylate synthase|nr:thymidylate synthase [Bacillota bacterium]NLB08876.1 thymidylate synthase [Clostridiales bacterium]